ncbi:MAG: DUF5063 domain-containing protein [Methylococcales bacterium]|jgi:hypothetical protein|nr:DUF5063 domain-containing protein [Methylococcales bacterium]MBT7410440.1 DUF5063 domain-containing protein [Methylococcales bacterium]
MANIESNFGEMIAQAKEYCQIIEHTHNDDDERWLVKLAALLPKLNATITALGKPDKDEIACIDPDLEKRFDLYSKLKVLLGEYDGYWMEYDAPQDIQSMSGSLADDFTDIYCELKCGLNVLEENQALIYQAIHTWQTSYYLHWGQHLVDAERHLYKLCSSNSINGKN